MESAFWVLGFRPVDPSTRFYDARVWHSFVSFSLDGVSVLCVGIGALRRDFTMLDFCIAFASFSLDGVSVLGDGLWASAKVYNACFWHTVVKLFLGLSQRFGSCDLASWALWRDFTVLEFGMAI